MWDDSKSKTNVLLDIAPVSLSDEDVQSYLRSSNFIHDMKTSRTAISTGIPDDEPFEMTASREQIGKLWIGVTEIFFTSYDRSFLVSERWWTRNGFAYHLLISSGGVQTPSSDSHQEIFKEFQVKLGLTSAKTAWSAFKIPEAAAQEARSARSRSQGQASAAPPSGKPQIECRAAAKALKIDPKRARKGPPVMNPAFSLKTCSAGAADVATGARDSIVSGYHSTLRYGAGVEQDFKNQYAQNLKQAKCLQKSDPHPTSTDASLYERFTRVAQNAVSSVAASGCMIAAGAFALEDTKEHVARDAATATYNTGSRAVQGVAHLVATVAPYADYIPNPANPLSMMKQVGLLRHYIEFKRQGGDERTVIYNYLNAHFPGLSCESDADQARSVCHFITKAGVGTLATLATSGAAGYVIAGRLAAATLETGEMIETAEAVEKAGEMASRAAEAARQAEEANEAASTAREAGSKANEAGAKATQPARPTAQNTSQPEAGGPSSKPPLNVTHHGDFTMVDTGPKVSRDTINETWRARFPKMTDGGRARINLPMAPSQSINKIELGAHETKEVSDWANNVLQAAKQAHPGEDLEVKGVDVGIGFNANSSYIHSDNGGTYLHATSTLEGGSSTIMMTESGTQKVRAAERALLESHGGRVFNSITGKNPDGSLNVEFFQRSSEPLQTMTIPAEDYVQPPAGTTAIFSGLDHVTASGGEVRAALHASPLSTDHATPWDRVTFFITIGPK